MAKFKYLDYDIEIFDDAFEVSKGGRLVGGAPIQGFSNDIPPENREPHLIASARGWIDEYLAAQLGAAGSN